MTAPAVVPIDQRLDRSNLAHLWCPCQDGKAPRLAICGHRSLTGTWDLDHPVCFDGCGCQRCVVCVDLHSAPCPACGATP